MNKKKFEVGDEVEVKAYDDHTKKNHYFNARITDITGNMEHGEKFVHLEWENDDGSHGPSHKSSDNKISATDNRIKTMKAQ